MLKIRVGKDLYDAETSFRLVPSGTEISESENYLGAFGYKYAVSSGQRQVDEIVNKENKAINLKIVWQMKSSHTARSQDFGRYVQFIDGLPKLIIKEFKGPFSPRDRELQKVAITIPAECFEFCADLAISNVTRYMLKVSEQQRRCLQYATDPCCNPNKINSFIRENGIEESSAAFAKSEEQVSTAQADEAKQRSELMTEALDSMKRHLSYFFYDFIPQVHAEQKRILKDQGTDRGRLYTLEFLEWNILNLSHQIGRDLILTVEREAPGRRLIERQQEAGFLEIWKLNPLKVGAENAELKAKVSSLETLVQHLCNEMADLKSAPNSGRRETQRMAMDRLNGALQTAQSALTAASSSASALTEGTRSISSDDSLEEKRHLLEDNNNNNEG